MAQLTLAPAPGAEDDGDRSMVGQEILRMLLYGGQGKDPMFATQCR